MATEVGDRCIDSREETEFLFVCEACFDGFGRLGWFDYWFRESFGFSIRYGNFLCSFLDPLLHGHAFVD